MQGGTGPGSFHDYSNSLQRNVNEFFWPKLSRAIATSCSEFKQQQRQLENDELDHDVDAAAGAACSFAMADFGCSCAWSTVNTMRFAARCVVDHHQASCAKQLLQRRPQLHIQAFFNDVPGNDFNTLFALLSDSCVVDEATTDAGQQQPHFMACGVPGSFYSRLFPPAYLHVGLCTLALHNLSQVPAAVKDPASLAWNENGTWILQGCKPETAMAYKEQFQKDFTCFLRHRSQELVPGGLLFCVIIASTIDHDANSTTTLQARLDHNHLHTNLQAAWRQLVSEGLLEQESLDAFNFPLFMPTIDEVKEVVCDDALVSAELEVVEMEYAEVERAPLHVWMEHAASDAQTWGITCETMARNFVGSLIQSHLGLPKFELLMERLRHVAAADGELLYRTNMMHVIVLALSRRR
ncbi:hypothetical protein L7F22_069287 [Adiantum nelumboides]|nr:hypothetical protein [Adiantum nelumboides]